MIAWLKSRLIAEARDWWKMASNQLALFTGAIVAVIVAVNPGALVAAYASIAALPPGPARVGGAMVAFLAFAGVPILVRLWKQERSE